MANKSLFASTAGRLVPRADAINEAGAPAYAYDARHALAQLAVTGTFADTFYQSAEMDLAKTLAAAEMVEPEFLAKTALYARQTGFMKDMPAVLLAVLARRDPALFRAVFTRVVENGKMLRTFVQVMRSGQTGRKSLGSAPKAMVQNWLNTASDWALLNANIGTQPSLADVIKMVHPKPASPAREALFAWIVGRPCDVALLPHNVQDYLAFAAGETAVLPKVPFQMLTQLPLTTEHWRQIARDGSWQQVRQNLNTFLRHGVFDDAEAVDQVATLLRDRTRIDHARVLPYQLMVTALNVAREMPEAIREALHDAMEYAVRRVPVVAGSLAVAVDVSGSMKSPVTGYRRGATTAMRCIDVASLVAAAFLRANPATQVVPFEGRVRDLRLEPRDTVLTNASKLAALGGGATNCSEALLHLAVAREVPDLVVFVSDNQSWMDTQWGNRGTAMAQAWELLKQANPRAKLVCVDIAPYGTTQVKSRPDVLNIGGFSDAVFEQIAAFAEDRLGPEQWTGEIEALAL
ncbi:MAG: RNA-binding protein [Pseudomonadota bacterium]